MNKILIPTDFSEHSDYALEYGSFITKAKGGKIFILHVVRHKEEEGKDFSNEIAKHQFLKGVNYEVVVEEGHNISKTINSVGERLGIDLIIMGSNGASNVGEMILGSNTENVIRHSKFNVLTIKHKMYDLKVNSILFPSNFSPESYAIFKTVKEFSDLFGAKIYLLRVNTPNHFEDTATSHEKMDMLIEHFRLKEEHKNYKKVLYDDKNEELGILNFCIDNDIDMIAIGSHGKSVLQKLLRVSTSQDIVRDSFRPVLTMRFP